MVKIGVPSLFVFVLLASPSFASFFTSEPRDIEHMEARRLDVMFRREVQAHKDSWVEVDAKLKVIDLPWLPLLSRSFLTRYRDLVLKPNNKPHGQSAHTEPPASQARGDTGITVPPVIIPIPIPSPFPSPVLSSTPIIPDTHTAVAERDYIQMGELHTRGSTDSHPDWPRHKPQIEPRDTAREKQLLTQAAQRGDIPSQYKLGQCYEYGYLNFPFDPRLSITWYTKAAEKGDAESGMALSRWYLSGSQGILKQSDYDAYYWALKAANKGLSKAMYAVGYYTELGIGTRQDIEVAKNWYIRAADVQIAGSMKSNEWALKGRHWQDPPKSALSDMREKSCGDDINELLLGTVVGTVTVKNNVEGARCFCQP